MRLQTISILLCVLLAWPVTSLASDAIPKQVHLVIEGKRLVASNARFSRFDDLKLNAGERIIEKDVDKAAIVLFTNQRIIGYGVLSGWRFLATHADEKLKELSAEDFAALVITTKRTLNFNGQTGVWGERRRLVTN